MTDLKESDGTRRHKLEALYQKVDVALQKVDSIVDKQLQGVENTKNYHDKIAMYRDSLTHGDCPVVVAGKSLPNTFKDEQTFDRLILC